MFRAPETVLWTFYFCGYPEFCKSCWQVISLHSVGSIPSFWLNKPWHSYSSLRSFSLVSWRQKKSKSPQATTWPTCLTTSLGPVNQQNNFYHWYADYIQLFLSFLHQNISVHLHLVTDCWGRAFQCPVFSLFLYFLTKMTRYTNQWFPDEPLPWDCSGIPSSGRWRKESKSCQVTTWPSSLHFTSFHLVHQINRTINNQLLNIQLLKLVQ